MLTLVADERGEGVAVGEGLALAVHVGRDVGAVGLRAQLRPVPAAHRRPHAYTSATTIMASAQVGPQLSVGERHGWTHGS